MELLKKILSWIFLFIFILAIVFIVDCSYNFLFNLKNKKNDEQKLLLYIRGFIRDIKHDKKIYNDAVKLANTIVSNNSGDGFETGIAYKFLEQEGEK